MSGGREIGEELDADFLLLAYCNGYFPMAESRHGGLGWFSPDPRGILPLESFTMSRSLRRVLARNVFEVKLDTAFEQVMAGCADRNETWISHEITRVYTELHRRGAAHSVESWCKGELAGGLYGVALGGAFFGESMFSRVTNASSVALAHLVDRLRQRGFVLLDTQYVTDHLRRFGAVEIPRGEYIVRLHSAVLLEARW